MSGQKQLKVIISADGSISVETVGIRGSKCLDFLGTIEDLVGATAVQSEFNADYAAIEDETSEEQGIKDAAG